MKTTMIHPAQQLVMIMDRIYQNGLTSTSGGNLSIMDDEGNIWITPSAIDKGRLTKKDIMKVYPDGRVEGIHTPSVELPFHANIYKLRPDIKAVLHAHPPALVAFSIVRQIPDVRCLAPSNEVCGTIVNSDYGLPGSKTLSDIVSAKFAQGYQAVMMENHGIVLGNRSLFDAYQIFEALDYTARAQINAAYLGKTHFLSTDQLAAYQQLTPPVENGGTHVASCDEIDMRNEVCALFQRCIRNQLFYGASGSFSCRIKDGFLITPQGADSAFLTVDDLVFVRNGQGEKTEDGRRASKYYRLHEEIYRANQEIQAIVTGCPPFISAFGMTGEKFDARLIPESYIMLKKVQRSSFGSYIQSPESVAEKISIKNPVMIVENDICIAAGSAPVNAYDRFEVLEYSAKSVIESKNIGSIVSIEKKDIEDIEVAFQL